jgi:hypothetical protein
MGLAPRSRLHPNRQAREQGKPRDGWTKGAEPVSTPTRPLVDIRNLVYRVGGRTVFDGVNIAVARGQVTAIIGAQRCRQDDHSPPNYGTSLGRRRLHCGGRAGIARAAYRRALCVSVFSICVGERCGFRAGRLYDHCA